jgi:hypothetical protein
MQKLLLTVVLMLLAGCDAARGQVNRPHSENNRHVASTPLVLLDSTRERDGLKGAVRRVETEVVKVELTRGELSQKSRSVLERTLYDERGRRVENETYPVGGDPAGQEIHSYDAQGNLAETVVRDARGATLSRTVYKYEFDTFGNWVKMTASVAVVNAGKVAFEPVEITNRNITYYLVDETGGAKASDDARARGAGSEKVSDGAERRGAHAEIEKRRGGSRVAHADVREIEVGVLNDQATSLPHPAFPVKAKRIDKPITVSVEVVVDITGRVAEAKAQHAPKSLQQAAEDAARRATFFPFYSEGRPVRARGWINFGFYFSP